MKTFEERRALFLMETQQYSAEARRILSALAVETSGRRFRQLLDEAIELKKKIESQSSRLEAEELLPVQEYMIRFACKEEGRVIEDFMEISWEEILEETK